MRLDSSGVVSPLNAMNNKIITNINPIIVSPFLIATLTVGHGGAS